MKNKKKPREISGFGLTHKNILDIKPTQGIFFNHELPD